MRRCEMGSAAGYQVSASGEHERQITEEETD